jgi:C4-dicarboxylate-specific signal transduction histidine kinase
VVSERRAASDAVREAEARLREKEAEAAQASRFMLVSGMASALAHEINQPLTAMRALARSVQHLLQTPEADLPRAERNLATMIAHIDHVGGVVRHMRDFLRRGRPHVSTIAVRGMLEEALMLVRASATAHRIRLDLEVAEGMPPIHGDRIQLEQVVLNLVRNAIEAVAGTGRDDGSVRVIAQMPESLRRIEIAVVDNGPGIPEEMARRLFEPLTTSKQEGLGLGLPICASIAEAHGGHIWLASREAGTTEFRLSLPLDPGRVA